MNAYFTTSLADICEFILDGTHGSPERSNSGIPVLSALNVVDGELSYETQRYTTAKEFETFRRRIDLRDGDLLLTIVGTIGRIAVVRNVKPAVFQRSVAILRSKSDLAHPSYLYYALQQKEAARQLLSMTNQSAQAGVYLGKLRTLSIPLPPLADQKRIAAILDKANAIRQKRQRAIRLADDFLRSVLLDMFGDPLTNPNRWAIVTVDDIKAPIKYSCVGGPFGSNLTRSDYVDSPGVPVIRGTNLSNETSTFLDNNFVYVSEEKADSLLQNIALPGDIVFTQRGTLGQIAQIPLESRYPRYVISQSQMKLTVDEKKADPIYLVRYFSTSCVVKQIEARTLATGVPHINLRILKDLQVLLPPIEKQRLFAKCALHNSHLLVHLQNALLEANQLFNSLTQRAFRGEL